MDLHRSSIGQKNRGNKVIFSSTSTNDTYCVGQINENGRKSNIISSAYAWAKPTQMYHKNAYAPVWLTKKRKKMTLNFASVRPTHNFRKKKHAWTWSMHKWQRKKNKKKYLHGLGRCINGLKKYFIFCSSQFYL